MRRPRRRRSPAGPRARGARPRSLGTGDERFSIVDRAAARLAPEDLLASDAAAVGASIGAAIASR
ncbi:MAG: hypothetical protein ACKORL_06745, partial [Phycisphaerales bacterium]